MASVSEHLIKLREDRMAREKARIEKLRELNLKKYSKHETPTLKPATSNISVQKSVQQDVTQKPTKSMTNNTKKSLLNGVNRPLTAPVVTNNNKTTVKLGQKDVVDARKIPIIKFNSRKTIDVKPPPKTINQTKIDKPKITLIEKKVESKIAPRRLSKIPEKLKKTDIKPVLSNGTNMTTNNDRMSVSTNVTQNKGRKTWNARHSTFGSVTPRPLKFDASKTKISCTENFRKSLQPPKLSHSATKPNPNRQSVFERLYQPKAVPKKPVNDVTKIQTDPNFLKRVIKNSEMIMNKRHSVYEPKKVPQPRVRRSISAIHFKRIDKNEINNCIHKWASIGDNLNTIHLKDIQEDASVKSENITSAVKSERKKVKFQMSNYNTPRPEELQSRLKSWLQKRGKSLDSYQHLQCFGIHHLAKKFTPLNLEQPRLEDKFNDDDENKENVPLESDSDNDSFDDNMNNGKGYGNDNGLNNDKWRRASGISDSVCDLNDTQETTLTPAKVVQVDEVLLGALADLTELLREGFDRDQCARWLRAIRERFPSAHDTAAYWECRAALEERRGDIPTSLQCWEEAIVKGTESSVAEANLDQLLDKFVQLKISPNADQKRAEPKDLNVDNIFKSTLIRFVVQHAKLRQSSQTPPKFICTPVRRSGRLITRSCDKRLTSSVRHALLAPAVFVPNDKLPCTP